MNVYLRTYIKYTRVLASNKGWGEKRVLASRLKGKRKNKVK